MNLLETTKLCKTYGGRTVVNEVSFTLSQQEIVGLLGRNGAGKTTTFRMILGMVVPDSGAVAFHRTRSSPICRCINAVRIISWGIFPRNEAISAGSLSGRTSRRFSKLFPG